MGDAMEYENLLIAATKVNERRAIEVTIKVEEAEE
jgi:hypothetical protein